MRRGSIIRGRSSALWLLILMVAFSAATACEALATESARSVVESGKEVRELERQEVSPLEDEMRRLVEDQSLTTLLGSWMTLRRRSDAPLRRRPDASLILRKIPGRPAVKLRLQRKGSRIRDRTFSVAGANWIGSRAGSEMILTGTTIVTPETIPKSRDLRTRGLNSNVDWSDYTVPAASQLKICRSKSTS